MGQRLVDFCTSEAATAADIERVAVAAPKHDPRLLPSLRGSHDASLRRSLDSLRRPLSLLPLPPSLEKDLARWQRQASLAVYERYARVRSTQWRSGVTELLTRLRSDWDLIVDAFGIGLNARVSSMSPAMGDYHNHGRCVYMLEFTDGARIVYKPRQVGTEETFNRLMRTELGEVEREAVGSHVIPRDGYGWTGFVNTLYCSSETDADEYYRRQGASLAMFFVLAAHDCTSDNLIIHRDTPRWIDTECICAPEIRRRGISLGAGTYGTQESVIMTGMLLLSDERGRITKRGSGLSACCMLDGSRIFDSAGALRSRYREAVAAGFAASYRRLMNGRHTWLTPEGAHGHLAKLRVRVLLRSTAFYGELLRAIAACPEGMTDITANEIANVLSRIDKQLSWPDCIAKEEIVCLKSGDIPFWTASTSSTELVSASGLSVIGVAEVSGLDRVERAATQMSVQDLERQLWLIKAYLGASLN